MAQWKQDPQEREDIEEVSKELELPIYKASALGKFRPWLKECWNKLEDYLINLKELANSKENFIKDKKTGFNLDKTNNTENDSNKLFTAKGALDLFNRLTTAISTAVENMKNVLRVDIAKKIDKTSISDSLTSTSTTTVLSSAGAKALEDTKVKSDGYVASYRDNGVPWNAKTGVYRDVYNDASALILHLYSGQTSANSAQLKFNYKNGGVWYRSSRDTNGFEEAFTRILTEKEAWKFYAKTIGNTTTATDLNNIIEPGDYISTSASNKWLSLPFGATPSFHLTVESIGSNYRVQTLRNHADNKIFRRVNASWDRWAWSAWERIDSLDKVNKAGDTMTGNLTINKVNGSYQLQRNSSRKMFLGFRNETNIDIVLYADEHGTEIALNDKVRINKDVLINNSKAVTEVDISKYSLFYPNTDKTLNNATEVPIEFFDANAGNSFNFIYSSADKSLKCTKGGVYRINIKLYVVIETPDLSTRSLVKFYKNSEILAYFELQARRGMGSSTNIVRLNPNDKLYIKHTNIAENYARVFKGGLELNNILIERLGD